MNIAEQMELALAPMWMVDLLERGIDERTKLGPGQFIPVRCIESVRIVGGNPPVWEWARRVIEGAAA